MLKQYYCYIIASGLLMVEIRVVEETVEIP